MLVIVKSYPNELPPQRNIEVQRVFSAFTCLALILVTITFSFGATRPSIATVSDVSWRFFNSFTPNSIMTFDVFVGLMFVGQLTYLVRLLASQNEALLICCTQGVSYQFLMFNVLQIFILMCWCWQRFVIVEFLLIANVVNLAKLGLRLGPTPHRTTAMQNINVQIPLVKMPLAMDLM